MKVRRYPWEVGTALSLRRYRIPTVPPPLLQQPPDKLQIRDNVCSTSLQRSTRAPLGLSPLTSSRRKVSPLPHFAKVLLASITSAMAPGLHTLLRLEASSRTDETMFPRGSSGVLKVAMTTICSNSRASTGGRPRCAGSSTPKCRTTARATAIKTRTDRDASTAADNCDPSSS